jgi:glutamine synthetase
VEVKVLDATANPYLACAAVLGAGLAGLADGAALPAPMQEDPAVLSAAILSERGWQRVPTDLARAAALFRANVSLRAILGEVLHDAVAAVSDREVLEAGDRDPAELAPAYRFRF